MPRARDTVPRPPNSFLLYRSHVLNTLPEPPEGTKRNQSEVSKMVGEMWRNETAEVKSHFEECAAIHKEEHAAAHPGYKYKPSRMKNNSLKPPKNYKAASKRVSSSPGSDQAQEASPSYASLSKKINPVASSLTNAYPQQGFEYPQSAYGSSSNSSLSTSDSDQYPQPAVLVQTFDYYPPYRNGGSIGFDDYAAYAVDSSCQWSSYYDELDGVEYGHGTYP